MEKEENRGRFAFRRRDIIISTLLVVSISAGLEDSNSEGHTSYKYNPLPQEDFKPVIIYHPKEDDKPNLLIPYSILEKASPVQRPILKEEITKPKVNNELNDVISTMEENNNIFSDKYIQDVKMYYPIYKTVADKFDIDWYLIWIVHENETGASAGWRGFTPESYYVGAMQRDPNIWPQSFVDKAADGLEALAKLPQRHENDWKEIAAGAAILDRNIDQYKNRGDSKDVAVNKAFMLYSADGPAEQRFDMYLKIEKIFR
jgi:hypothetical protein